MEPIPQSGRPQEIRATTHRRNDTAGTNTTAPEADTLRAIRRGVDPLDNSLEAWLGAICMAGSLGCLTTAMIAGPTPFGMTMFVGALVLAAGMVIYINP